MEESKVCFGCLCCKKLSDFYKHSGMKDGHLNKCKECIKHEVRNRYKINIESDVYVEKERERGRIKYHKYKYKNKTYQSNNKNTRRFLKSNGVFIETNEEVHHWNYNKKNDVFIINRRAHSLIHKYMIFDSVSNMFYSKLNNEILNTQEKHFDFIKKIFDIKNVEYKIKYVKF